MPDQVCTQPLTSGEGASELARHKCATGPREIRDLQQEHRNTRYEHGYCGDGDNSPAKAGARLVNTVPVLSDGSGQDDENAVAPMNLPDSI